MTVTANGQGENIGSTVAIRGEAQPTLAELREIANREHGLALRAGAMMLEHAINAGEALLAAKKQIPWGQWEEWVAENFADRSKAVATQYMRIARYKDLVLEKQPTNIKGALRVLHGQRDSRIDPVEKAVDQAEALRLRATGKSYRAIAVEMGIPTTRVVRYCDPTAAERHRKRERQRTLAGRRALHRQGAMPQHAKRAVPSLRPTPSCAARSRRVSRPLRKRRAWRSGARSRMRRIGSTTPRTLS